MTADASSKKAFDWHSRDIAAQEVVGEGVTLEWLGDGGVVYFRISNLSRLSVDAWLNRSIEIAQGWPVEIPYLAIQDITDGGFTPYIRERSAAAVAATPKALKGRSAVVMFPNPANRVVQLFVTVSLARQQTGIQRKVFLKKDEAVQWVLNYKPTV